MILKRGGESNKSERKKNLKINENASSKRFRQLKTIMSATTITY